MYPLVALLFHDGGPYHIEISPLICKKIQQTISIDNRLNLYDKDFYYKRIKALE